MFAGMALSVRLYVCAGLSLFIIYGPYLYVVVCVFYAYNLTQEHHYSILNAISATKILTNICDGFTHFLGTVKSE